MTRVVSSFINFLSYVFAIISLGIILINIFTYFSTSDSSLRAESVLGATNDASDEYNRQQIAYWEKIVKNYPTYVDGYLKLSVLYSERGDKKQASKNIDLALNVDPNSEKVRQLKIELGL
jgi:tetratricopeptide (TPR) repeat protein